MKKKADRKLSLTPETLRVLHATEITDVAGGMLPETRWTFCDQVPTQCYKPNPY